MDCNWKKFSNKLDDRGASFLILIYTTLYFFKIYLGNLNWILISTSLLMAGIGCSSLIYIIFFSEFKTKSIINFLLLFLITSIVSSVFNSNYRIQDYFLILQYMGIGLLLINYRLVVKYFKINLYFYFGFFLVNILFGVSPNDIFIVSRNNISIILLLNILLYYIATSMRGEKIIIIPAFLNVLLSFWAEGRSGIITSLIMLIGVFFIVIKDNIKKVKSKNLFLAIGLGGVIFVGLYTFLYDEFLKISIYRIKELGFTDPARSGIIKEYFYQIESNFCSFLFGVKISGNEVFRFFENNLHNSYLRLHSFYGIVGTVIMLILIIKSLSYYIERKMTLNLLIILIILIRISTDIAAFHGPFDPLIYYIIFNYMKNEYYIS